MFLRPSKAHPFQPCCFANDMMTSLHTETGRGRDGAPPDLLRFLSALLSSMLEGPASPPAATWAIGVVGSRLKHAVKAESNILAATPKNKNVCAAESLQQHIWILSTYAQLYRGCYAHHMQSDNIVSAGQALHRCIPGTDIMTHENRLGTCAISCLDKPIACKPIASRWVCLTLARPCQDNIVVEGLVQVALDLKMVNLDFHGLTNVAVAWASRAWRLGQYLQVHTFSHILSAPLWPN